MKKLIKNKIVLIIAVIIAISIVYFTVEKAIDNYNFQDNKDISTDDNIGEISEVTMEVDKSGNNLEELKEDTDLLENSGELKDDEIIEFPEDIADETIEVTKDKMEVKNKIYVYITGEVNNPGVVILNEGGRIIDAINAAGGTTVNANITKVNLVYVLEDGMKVNIPNNNDLKNNSNFEYITMGSGDGRKDNPLNEGVNNPSRTDSEYSNLETSSKNSSSGFNKYSVVNINTATQTELETLPGIGPSLALKIINYRKENGKFSSIEQIKNVSGIGESKFEELKNYIKV